MKTRTMRRVTVRYAWDRLKVSFWFAPLVMSLGAVLLARVMYWVDSYIPNDVLAYNRFIMAGNPADMRAMLIGMATTVLATAGVVFTLLTLPLGTVAAQYGSRLLRVFLGDRITQLVLGMFVSTFVYCIVAATSIPPEAVQPEGPQISATVGLFLGLATFASLVLLVQHISTMLQAPNIAAAAGAELLDVIRAEVPEKVASGVRNRPGRLGSSRQKADGYPVRVSQPGYIQFIDPAYMLTLAHEKNLLIRLLRGPGHFVRHEAVVALVWPAAQIDQRLDRQLRRAFQVGNVRTPTQDIAYAFNQLVEMGVRAMSPAINDPFTAMTCLDYIGDGLALFIRQGEKPSHYYDRDGRLRLVLEPVRFDQLLNGAFDMLRHCSCDNASVLLQMLKVIDTICQETKSPESCQQLLRHVSLIQAESLAGALTEQDRQLIQHRAEALQSKLNASG